MNKKIITFLFYALFLNLLAVKSTFSEQKVSIAIVNIDKIFKDVNYMKKEREKFENDKKDFENYIRQKEISLHEEQEDIESKASILSKEKMQQKREEFQKKVMELQKEIADKNSKLQERASELQEKLINEINNILKSEKYKEYAIILNSIAVMQNNGATDITQNVIKDLNKKK